MGWKGKEEGEKREKKQTISSGEPKLEGRLSKSKSFKQRLNSTMERGAKKAINMFKSSGCNRME